MSQRNRPTPASQSNSTTWMRPTSVSSHHRGGGVTVGSKRIRLWLCVQSKSRSRLWGTPNDTRAARTTPRSFHYLRQRTLSVSLWKPDFFLGGRMTGMINIPSNPCSCRLEQTFLASHGRQRNRSRRISYTDSENGRESPSVHKPPMVKY